MIINFALIDFNGSKITERGRKRIWLYIFTGDGTTKNTNNRQDITYVN